MSVVARRSLQVAGSPGVAEPRRPVQATTSPGDGVPRPPVPARVSLGDVAPRLPGQATASPGDISGRCSAERAGASHRVLGRRGTEPAGASHSVSGRRGAASTGAVVSPGVVGASYRVSGRRGAETAGASQCVFGRCVAETVDTGLPQSKWPSGSLLHLGEHRRAERQKAELQSGEASTAACSGRHTSEHGDGGGSSTLAWTSVSSEDAERPGTRRRGRLEARGTELENDVFACGWTPTSDVRQCHSEAQGSETNSSDAHRGPAARTSGRSSGPFAPQWTGGGQRTTPPGTGPPPDRGGGEGRARVPQDPRGGA